MQRLIRPNADARPTARAQTPRAATPCVFEAVEHRRLMSTTVAGEGEPAGFDAGSSDTGLFAPARNNQAGTLSAPASKDYFRVYSALRHDVDPVAGVTPIKISYSELFVRDADGNIDRDQIDESVVRRQAREASQAGVPWVLDIEHWPVDIRSASEAEVRASVARFVEAINWAKDERPDIQVGFYGILPLRDYWNSTAVEQYENRLIDGSIARDTAAGRAAAQAQVDGWRDANDFLAPLAEAVDVIFPSLYTFYEDQPGWVDFAEASIAEAKTYGKPVVPFLWPRYHNSHPDRAYEPLEADYWQLQLDTVRALADGLVVWDGPVEPGEPDGWRDQLSSFSYKVRHQEFSLDRVLRQERSATATPGVAGVGFAQVVEPVVAPAAHASVAYDSLFDAETDEKTFG